MTHGFDDEGSKYDGKGNLREWQTADDRKAFMERTECEVDEYGGFEAAPAHGEIAAQNLNGKLTLGENTADNGGLRIAYMALLDTLAEEGKTINEKIDGYTEAQRYFIGFAQVWCQNQTEAGSSPGWRSSIRTRQAVGASTAPCRTSTSSARPSVAHKASRCTPKTPAASGNPRSTRQSSRPLRNHGSDDSARLPRRGTRCPVPS